MTVRPRPVRDEERWPHGATVRVRAAAALTLALGVGGCDDLIEAGRAAIAPAPADSIAAPAAPEPAAAPAGSPTGRRVPSGSADLLGTPAWEGERSAVADELQAIFRDERVEGVIVVHDLRSGATLRSDPGRAGRRTPPGATFEVLLALIALDAGILSGPADTLGRGADAVPPDEAAPAPALAPAFRSSNPAFFEEAARRVGSERFEASLRRVGYGNANAAGPTDAFWTAGPLAISPDEQIGFLRRLRAGELPFSSRAMEVVRELMTLDGGDSWDLRGKTGWHRGARTDVLWFVGWVDRGPETALFAIEFENEIRARDVQALRERVYRRALTELGLIPTAR